MFYVTDKLGGEHIEKMVHKRIDASTCVTDYFR